MTIEIFQDGLQKMQNDLLQVEVKDIECLHQLAEDWNSLFDRVTDAWPYLSFPWVDTFIRQKRTGINACILTVWAKDNKLVAIWPLTIRKHWGAKIAEPIGTGVPSYLGLLIDPDYISAIKKIVHYCQDNALFDAYYCTDLSSEDQDTLLLLEEFQKKGYLLTQSQRNICFYVKLKCAFDDYLSTTKTAKRRKQLRYEEKKLFSSNPTEICCYQGTEVTDEVLERIVAIQNSSWMVRRGVADLDSSFYHDLVFNMAAAELCDVWIMRINGEDAAFVLAFIHQGYFQYYRTAFNVKYGSQLSIGKILTMNVIRDACGRGITHFDFGHGYGEYKAFWGTNSYRVNRVVIASSIRGRILVYSYALIWDIARVKWIKSLYRRIFRSIA